MTAHLAEDLVIDVGNSRIKLGLFNQGRITSLATAAHHDLEAVEQFCGGHPPRCIIVGSVAGPNEGFVHALGRLAPVKEVTGGSPSPVRSLYQTPATFGVDRLANVVGAAALFPQRPVLAIDLGTCITYDLVDELAVHQGGNISPGLHMRARAMHAYSARLPLVDPHPGTPLLGTGTASSLAAGCHHGLLMELAGFIGAFRQQHRHLAVVLTGGDAPNAARALKNGIFAHPTLTLIGLHAIALYDPDPRPVAHP
ncbi:MAG: type III pantothenate kinase [Flavobacteriales bacterium]|nr:type III pantothenate kinase [Flavobacteriales bacterium]MBP9079140.1 type III pantothenate kinase [Flavobacteriales bacterium]